MMWLSRKLAALIWGISQNDGIYFLANQSQAIEVTNRLKCILPVDEEGFKVQCCLFPESF